MSVWRRLQSSPLAILALGMTVLCWPTWVSRDLISSGDVLLQHYPWQVLLRDELAQGRFPFWNPYGFSGVPAFANPQAAYAYPPHWALLWLPPIQAINWSIGLHLVIAAVGAGWCARRMGAPPAGQVLAGFAFALGGATTARLWAGHLDFLEADAWLPVATALALDLRRPRSVALLAVVMALAILTGRPEIPLFSTWWLPVWAVAARWSDGWRARAVAVGLVLVALALAVGLAAVQLVPTLALIGTSTRQAGVSFEFATAGSLHPALLLGAIAPLVFGDPRVGGYWPGAYWEWQERLLYVGLVPLAAVALARGRWRWVCWGLAALAVALAFGGYSPWYEWVQRLVPGYGSVRIPSKHLTLAALALSLGAGLGIAHLRGVRVGRMMLAGGVALGLVSAATAVVAVLGGDGGSRADVVRSAWLPLGVAAVTLVAAWAVIRLAPSGWTTRALVALAVVDLTLVLGPFRLQAADLNGFLAYAEPLRGHERVAVVGPLGNALAQAGPLVRVVQPAGYGALFSAAYARLVSAETTPDAVIVNVASADDPVLPLLGYAEAYDPDLGTFTATAGIARPPAWTARCAMPGDERTVRAASFPRDRCVTMAGLSQPVQQGEPTDAQLVAEEPGYLAARASGPGWLTTRLPWYPGWSATVDGAETPVTVVDGALVAVQLADGEHMVTLRYLPAGLREGVAVSGLAVIGTVLLLAWDRRRAPPAPVAPQFAE